MPIDLSIPSIIDIYLELIQKLSSISSQHDSGSNEAQIIKKEIEHYLGLIRAKMFAVAENHEKYEDGD